MSLDNKLDDQNESNFEIMVKQFNESTVKQFREVTIPTLSFFIPIYGEISLYSQVRQYPMSRKDSCMVVASFVPIKYFLLAGILLS